MKKFIALAALLALVAVTAWSFKGESRMKLVETVHDFGTIKENGGPVKCEFEFVNQGNAPLVIFDATAECGCTRPDYPKNPIAPGKKGKIKVTYNPLGRPGAFDKTVTIKTNGTPKKLRVKIRGNVTPRK